LTDTTDLTTLYLDVNSADDQYIKVNNFGGSSVILTELDSGGTDGERVTIDGTGSNALTVTARGFKADTGAGELVATGVASLTVTGTSYISTSAQDNVLGAITAANASGVTLSTSGNSTASNTTALTVASLTAANATSVTVSVGQNDTLTVTNDIATTNALVDTLSVTLADDSTLTISGGDIDLKTSAVQNATFTVGTGATVSAVDLEAATVTTLTATLSAASTTTLDLNAAITKGTVTMSSGSTWTLDTAGAASAASSLTISGRGDVAEGTQIDLVGTDFTFDAGSLIDSDGLLLTGATLTGKLTATGTSGADTITGGGYADTINGGAGADSLVGGAGNDSISGGDGADSITGSGGADLISLGSVATDVVVLAALTDTFNSTTLFADGGTVAAFDKISGVTNGDQIDFAAIGTLTNGATVGSTFLASLADSIALIRGVYDATAGTFTAGTGSTANDYMVQFGETTGTTNAGVLLIDITGTVSLAYASEIATISVS